VVYLKKGKEESIKKRKAKTIQRAKEGSYILPERWMRSTHRGGKVGEGVDLLFQHMGNGRRGGDEIAGET